MQLTIDGQMVNSMNDSTILKQVLASHAAHGREFVVDPVMNITEQILSEAIAIGTSVVNGKEERPETSKETASLAELDTHHALLIQKLSHELSSCKCLGQGANARADAKTMDLLNTLNSYPWHAKLVLVLSGFAVNFGEFCLFSQPYPDDILSESLALFWNLPNIRDKSSPLKHLCDTLNKLVRVSLDVTKCMVEIWNLPFYYISEKPEDSSAMSFANALIPEAVYWAIRSIVSCSSQIASIISLRYEYISSSAETWELSYLASKVKSIRRQLMNQLDMCYQYIEEKLILQSLTYCDEDNLRIDLSGSYETRADMENQKQKHLLMLISDLNISEKEIQKLKLICQNQPMESGGLFEMVWVPVVEKSSWNSSNQRKFKNLKSMMPWRSFHRPLNDSMLIKQIKEEWNFTGRLIVVVRGPQGRVTSTNAIDMMWIWGNSAFPFSSEREEELWNTESGSLVTIIGGIFPPMLEWMDAGENIWLYGGKDIEWIRRFTKTMASAASASNYRLKMVFVGTSTENQFPEIKTIAEEKLNYFLPNDDAICSFWKRLENILYSKSKFNKTEKNDQVMGVVTSIHTYDSIASDKGWAILFRGSDKILDGSGTAYLTMLEKFESEEKVKTDGFVPALLEYWLLHKFSESLKCSSGNSITVDFSWNIGDSYNNISCPRCSSSMEKYALYRCC